MHFAVTTNCLLCSSLLVCPALYLTIGLWELQQFDIQLEHILGKKNVVSDAIYRPRTLGLYQNNGNDNIATTDDDVVENVIEEVHAIKWVPDSAGYNMDKLNLDTLREEQWPGTFCIKRVKALRTKQDNSFMLDYNSIL